MSGVVKDSQGTRKHVGSDKQGKVFPVKDGRAKLKDKDTFQRWQETRQACKHARDNNQTCPKPELHPLKI
jgi:hypothetical protein